MNNPLVSIITVSFRDLDGLKTTAASVESQLGDICFEWIINDGGSGIEVENYLATLPAYTNWVSRSDKGIYDGMKKGLERARGTYVIFLNSGDTFIDPNVLNSICAQLSDTPQIDVLFFSSYYCASRVKVLRTAKPPLPYLFHSPPGNQQATLYRRSAIDLETFPVDYQICGDFALTATLWKRGAVMARSKTVVTNFQLGGRSTFAFKVLLQEAWSIQRDILKLTFPLRVISAAFRLINMSKALLLYKVGTR